ncbi:MAG TPA: glycosyltransferase family 4 protein, partial [Paraburkholderia sp.]|uniref:glycosyltransferase family 4 protein n=1 Tax=Paraburkholderia sp. TaxID=1926495 RepID=UPI002B49C897
MALTSDVSEGTLVRYASASAVQYRSPYVPNAEHAQAREKGGRILFINRYFYPDVSATSQILFDLAKRLVEHGLDVHVVCSRQLYEDPSAALPAHETIHGIKVHRALTTRFGRGNLIGRAADYASFYVTGAANLLLLLRAGDVVVAKTDPPLISIAAAAIAKTRGARLVNWLQDLFPEVATHLDANPLPAWLDKLLKGMRDRSLRSAEVNVVLGSRMREQLGRCGIPNEKIRIIENWADGDLVEPKPVEASSLRKELGLANKFVVAYSGNLGRAHEYHTLLGAAEAMRDDRDVVFLMVGGGARLEELRCAVEFRGLPNFVFLPYQPRELLADALAAADVHLACLLPELEGLIVPSKFYGILAAGRPAVFIGDTDGELARIIDEFRCGSVVQTGDSQALVRALWVLRHREELRQEMGVRARQLFLRKYTVGRATREWLNLISQL